jgi:hypothetical protein
MIGAVTSNKTAVKVKAIFGERRIVFGRGEGIKVSVPAGSACGTIHIESKIPKS